MGLDIGGSNILTAGSGISFNGGLTFNSSGFASMTSVPGYCGYKDISGNELHYSATTGWPINVAPYTSGHLNTSTGVFTCPVAGYYAIGYNGIGNGGTVGWDNNNSQGYACFAKNGSLTYYSHWNLSSASGWDQCGMSCIFNCAANDTLAFFINRSPSPVTDAQAYNRGWYPHSHHAIWCILIG
jgi:hypothetical protein